MKSIMKLFKLNDTLLATNAPRKMYTSIIISGVNCVKSIDFSFDMVDAMGVLLVGLRLLHIPAVYRIDNILTERRAVNCAVPETWSTLTETTPLTLSIAA